MWQSMLCNVWHLPHCTTLHFMCHSISHDTAHHISLHHIMCNMWLYVLCSVAKHGVYCYMKRCGAMWNVVQLHWIMLLWHPISHSTPHVVVWCGKAWCSNIVTHSTSHHMHHSTSRITLHVAHHVTIPHHAPLLVTSQQHILHMMHHSASQKCDTNTTSHMFIITPCTIF